MRAARVLAPATRAYSSEGANEAKDSAKTETPEKSEKDLLAEKDKQIAELKDQYLRALADTENVRQQMRRQVEETSQFAIRKFAKDLLDTVDVLGMALQSVPKAKLEAEDACPTLKSLHVGVSMTEAELLKALKRHGVEPFDALNQPFDPNMHQAMFQAPVPGKEPGTVFQVEKRGFTIKERVLRPAQVGVVKSN
ncbi:GrpE nucleotide exchange factor [Thamnocephalis sphaerospora]|uniref:GrpE protein homolog n=1 Tax=Thamnocephalis sphaerospora TaxID=78915 RepID=A0A4V1IVS5_9FUNG|nr:GrpE nucleotide exchange factor [Thamnocephalis sphaerospora]|eukprot:RKP05079.1 GrpE nucleotide exchange factor [Thamnocephalis sphaerospora]